MQEVDFVIAWVDSQDEKWLKEKQQYDPTPILKANDLTGDIRFRDWGLLKYWFRGVENFAPWVNKIHFITYGHVPEWLSVNHPKLNIVKHEDFIDLKYLPTFNSGTIELNLHKIKGLSDHFVYFNDDFYIIDSLKKTDFFKDGLPCDEGVFGNVFFENPATNYGLQILYMTGIINKNFDFLDSVKRNKDKFLNDIYEDQLYHNEYFIKRSLFPGLYNHHLPQSFKKSTFQDVWNKEYDLLDNACMEKFRTVKLIHQYLIRFWQVMSGDFEPSLHRKLGYSFPGIVNDLDNILLFIENQERQIIVINDNDEVENLNKYITRVEKSFQSILPEKSLFEK